MKQNCQQIEQLLWNKTKFRCCVSSSVLFIDRLKNDSSGKPSIAAQTTISSRKKESSFVFVHSLIFSGYFIVMWYFNVTHLFKVTYAPHLFLETETTCLLSEPRQSHQLIHRSAFSLLGNLLIPTPESFLFIFSFILNNNAIWKSSLSFMRLVSSYKIKT